MTDSNWITATDPHSMLKFLHESGRLSPRKATLFAAACFRRLIRLLPDTRQHAGIDTVERMAEGVATPEARRAAASGARRAIPSAGNYSAMALKDDPPFVALMLYRALVSQDQAGHAVHAFGGLADWVAERAGPCRLLRDIVANPFVAPPRIDLAWLAWDDGTIAKLAEAAYQERSLPRGELDSERLAVLADALEEVGTDELLLDHLRGPGPHVRGCFVLDMLTGRE
jgi:hypothetical protein